MTNLNEPKFPPVPAPVLAKMKAEDDRRRKNNLVVIKLDEKGNDVFRWSFATKSEADKCISQLSHYRFADAA